MERRRVPDKIDQSHWEHQSKHSQETSAISNPDQKSEKTSKLNPNSDQNGKTTSLPSASKSSSTDKANDKSKYGGNQMTDAMDRLGTDGKLTLQEHQQCFDNELCLLCGKSDHMVCDCPKSTKVRAAKASDSKSSETKAKFMANACEAKKLVKSWTSACSKGCVDLLHANKEVLTQCFLLCPL